MEKINLHSRQKNILSILNAKHGIVTGKELSAKTGVSERTIRNDISEINDCLKSYDIQIQAVHGKGYTLSIPERSTFLKLFSEKENYVTKEDRIRTLTLKLLRQDDWCDVGDLEDEMFVSHTTLEKDIKGIKNRISLRHPYLKLERKGTLIRIEDDERKKRDLLIRFYVENWDYDSEDGIVLEYEADSGQMLNQIQSVLKSFLIPTHVFLDDYAFIYLTMTVYVSMFRMQTGHGLGDVIGLLPDRAGFIGKPADSKDLTDEVMKQVIDCLNEDWKLEIGAAEYAYMSGIKKHLVLLSERTYSKNHILSMTDIDCHRIVDDILGDLFDSYGVDFTLDDKLFVDLTRHAQALKNGIVPTNLQNRAFGDELRKKHPLMGDIAHAVRLRFASYFDIELGMEEEDYLLPFMVLSSESLYKRRRGKGIRTAVISHYNESMSHYLIEQLKRYYGDVLELHGPYAIHARELIDSKETRLVLTTVKMKSIDSMFDVPVLTVSPLVEMGDRRRIDFYLDYLKCCFLYAYPSLPACDYFPNVLCYTDTRKSNLLDVLSQMQLKAADCAGIDTLQEIDLENDYSVLFSNGFFFCYQIHQQAEHTLVSVVDVGRDVSCKYVRNIKTVMYLLMPPKERPMLGWFYYIAMALADHPAALRKAFESETVGELAQQILSHRVKL